ncbi:MAG: response regulator [Spirochaetaceae bacterium]
MATILIVDDDPLVRAHLAAILKGAEYRVVAAESAEQALIQLENKPPDVLVADYYMPGKTGGDLLRSIRSAGNHVPFVALTASDEVDTAVELFTSGADDYLTKPVQSEALLFRIEKVLETRDAKEIARKITVERELVELERKQLFSWRQLYATKEARQTKQIIELLSRAINHGGGFLWVELLRDYLKDETAESCELPRALVSMIVEAGESQKQIFDYITFIGNLESLELKDEEVPAGELKKEFAEKARAFLVGLSEAHPRQFDVLEAARFPDGTVVLDRGYLASVLEELLINAVKYSPGESRIVVDFSYEEKPDGSFLVINVENEAKRSSARDASGEPIIGIPYEQSELIFDLFYTLDAFPTAIPEEQWKDGSGLYIARRLLKRFGASIEVANGLDYTRDIPRPIVRFAVRLPITQGASE